MRSRQQTVDSRQENKVRPSRSISSCMLSTAYCLLFVFAVYCSLCAPVFGQEDATEHAKGVQDTLAGVLQKVQGAFVNIGGGSGIVISPDGLALTNYHVVGMQRSRNSKKVSNKLIVRMPGGRRGKRFEAKILWRDRSGDICLLKLDTKGEAIPHVEMADSDKARVGQLVFALGSPFMTAREDRVPSVSFGVISALHRYIANPGAPGIPDAIQTDAPVNPGNSGGPLLDLDGKLLGINAQIRVRHPYRINTGIGLAIPANQIKRFIEAFKDVTDGSEVYHGRVQGLALAKKAQAGGAVVENVAPGSAARAAGFKPGDLIVRVNSYTIFNRHRFLGVVGTYPAGSTVDMALRRGDQEHKLSVTLEGPGGRRTARPPRLHPLEKAKSERAYLGVRFSTTPHADGVEVEKIVPGQPADKAGLKVGDIVTEFDGKKVANLDDMRKAVGAKKAADIVKLKVLRDAEIIELELTLGKWPRHTEEK